MQQNPMQHDPIERSPASPDRIGPDRINPDRMGTDRMGPDRMGPDRMGPDRMGPDRINPDRIGPDRMGQGTGPVRPAHPIPIRVMHWVGACAIFCMIFSGISIYNASPVLPFNFPSWMMLGGWLAGGIAWHITAMWVLFVDGIAYLGYGFATGHFRRDIGLPAPNAVARDLAAALRGRLGHRIGHYNAVQRTLYAGVLVTICLAVATGLSIWKPVQLFWLSDLFGGYPVARVVHLGCMLAIATFIVLHVVLVALYPRTLVSMLASTNTDPES
jgi:thiosulfate reductase cytochrome b subunit